MISRTLLLLTLCFTCSVALASDSWFDGILNALGFGDAEEQTQTSAVTKSITDAISPSTANISSLASLVTSQLGVTDAQAKGGLGTLFGLAKSTLATTDFSTLSKMVPDMDGLLKAAPELSEKAKGLSSLMGNAGKYASVLQDGTKAYSQFKTLGLTVDQIPKYIDVTTGILESKGGKDATSLFTEGVATLLTSTD